MASKEYQQEWRRKNKDKIKKYHQERYIRCKEQINDANRKWKTNNREQLLVSSRDYYQRNKLKVREHYCNRTHNISLEEYTLLEHQQNYRCAICKKQSPGGNRWGSKGNWHIDHCHETNQVRGLLCNKCNMALGLFEEDTESLKNAISYLEKYEK